MKTVIYVPLVNHLTRRFIAATPVGARLATPLGAEHRNGPTAE